MFQVSTLFSNLISIKKLANNSTYSVYFDDNICVIFDKVEHWSTRILEECGGPSLKKTKSNICGGS